MSTKVSKKLLFSYRSTEGNFHDYVYRETLTNLVRQELIRCNVSAIVGFRREQETHIDNIVVEFNDNDAVLFMLTWDKGIMERALAMVPMSKERFYYTTISWE